MSPIIEIYLTKRGLSRSIYGPPMTWFSFPLPKRRTFVRNIPLVFSGFLSSRSIVLQAPRELRGCRPSSALLKRTGMKPFSIRWEESGPVSKLTKRTWFINVMVTGFSWEASAWRWRQRPSVLPYFQQGPGELWSPCNGSKT